MLTIGRTKTDILDPYNYYNHREFFNKKEKINIEVNIVTNILY